MAPPSIAIFDPNITLSSPAGSCLLKIIPALAESHSLYLFVSQTDAPLTREIRKLRVPLPPGPVFLRDFLFTILATLRYLFSGLPEASLKIGTQGGFPLCDLSYAHCCHKLFLTRYRDYLGGGTMRRFARLLTHRWGASMERVAFRRARTIVVPSQGLARELAAAYPGRVAGKIRVIPNPVNTAAFARPANFSPLPIHARFNITPGEFVFSFCALGNFDWKGLPLAIRALATFKDQRAHLLVIGGSLSEVSSIQDLAAKVGLAEFVHLTGFQKDIRPYLWSSNAFVFPSVYETFALVCLQAAAASLPLLTTPLYGLEEFAIDGKTGWIVERQIDSIAAAMELAIANPLAAAAMGDEARQRVAVYNEDAFRARWVSLINEEISKSAG